MLFFTVALNICERPATKKVLVIKQSYLIDQKHQNEINSNKNQLVKGFVDFYLYYRLRLCWELCLIKRLLKNLD